MDIKLLVKTKTPYKSLELKPGEIVQVKNIEEILKTLNWKGRNRGLYYDMNGEMLKYCNKKVKVLKRVRKVIDEKTGKLTVLKNESVILEGCDLLRPFQSEQVALSEKPIRILERDLVGAGLRGSSNTHGRLSRIHPLAVEQN